MSPFSNQYTFEQIAQYGIALVVFLSMLFAIAYIVWGGFLMVVSGGDEAKVKAAVNHMRYALLGVVVLFVVLFVAPIFFRWFGLPYGEYFSPAQIIATIQEIANNLLGTSSDTVHTTNPLISPQDPGFTEL